MSRFTIPPAPPALLELTEPPATDLRPRWRVVNTNPGDLQLVLNRLDAEGYRVGQARYLTGTLDGGMAITVIAEALVGWHGGAR